MVFLTFYHIFQEMFSLRSAAHPEDAHAQNGAAARGEAQGGDGHRLMFLGDQQLQSLAKSKKWRNPMEKWIEILIAKSTSITYIDLCIMCIYIYHKFITINTLQ